VQASELTQRLARGLIVSCQPLPHSPLDRDDFVVAMALAAESAGACAVRIEGVDRVRLAVSSLRIPVIGIVKRDLPDTSIRITPNVEDVRALAEAGAAVVAFDATSRPRPAAICDLVAQAHALGAQCMADCATEKEGVAAWSQGCELIGSTLSGYTADTAAGEHDDPDFALVKTWSDRGLRVVAEGRIRTPAQAAQALASGAHCVTVGSAITRIEHITQWFVQAMRGH
jgi:N-acylglucosamine-6-phosphate 2-epimerase